MSTNHFRRVHLLAVVLAVTLIGSACGGASDAEVDELQQRIDELESAASTTTAADTTTTTTSTSTTSTTSTTVPESVPEVALSYFKEIARNTDASLKRAASSSIGRASTYAGYLAAGGEGTPGESEEDDGSVVICHDYEKGTSCFEYSEFVLSSTEKLWEFSIDGVPIRTVLWQPNDIDDGELCVHYDEPCDFENPEIDSNAYLLPSYAYRSASGHLVIIIDVITGQRNLDVLWDNSAERLRATATKKSGDVVYPDMWWTNPDVATSSSLGMRIPKHSRAFLVLGFPGFGGAVDEIRIEVPIDWGGRHTLEIDLPDLPDA